jgi:hypothetical protein
VYLRSFGVLNKSKIVIDFFEFSFFLSLVFKEKNVESKN